MFALVKPLSAVFALSFLLPCLAESERDGLRRWLYPQMEMELYRVHEMRNTVRRMGMYAAHPGLLPVNLGMCKFRRQCAEDEPLPEIWGHLVSTRYEKAESRRYLEVAGGFCGCGPIRSAESGWEALTFDGTWHAAAAYPDAPVPPHRERLPEDRSFTGLVASNGWYDAGEELIAHIECAAKSEPRRRY